MESRALRFAAAARSLGEAARAAGFESPAFRSPPRLAGLMRTVRRHASGSATVSVVLKGRPWLAVVSDMIEGFVAVNTIDADGQVDVVQAQRLRELLWDSVTQVDLTGGEAGSDSDRTRLRLVDHAA